MQGVYVTSADGTAWHMSVEEPTFLGRTDEGDDDFAAVVDGEGVRLVFSQGAVAMMDHVRSHGFPNPFLHPFDATGNPVVDGDVVPLFVPPADTSDWTADYAGRHWRLNGGPGAVVGTGEDMLFRITYHGMPWQGARFQVMDAQGQVLLQVSTEERSLETSAPILRDTVLRPVLDLHRTLPDDEASHTERVEMPTNDQATFLWLSDLCIRGDGALAGSPLDRSTASFRLYPRGAPDEAIGHSGSCNGGYIGGSAFCLPASYRAMDLEMESPIAPGSGTTYDVHIHAAIWDGPTLNWDFQDHVWRPAAPMLPCDSVWA